MYNNSNCKNITKEIYYELINYSFLLKNGNVFVKYKSKDIYKFLSGIECDGYICDQKFFVNGIGNHDNRILKYTQINDLKDINFLLFDGKSGTSCFAVSEKHIYAWGAGENCALGSGYMNDNIKHPQVIFSCKKNDKIKICDFRFRTGFVLTENGLLYTWGWNNAGAGHINSNYLLHDYELDDSVIQYENKIHNAIPRIPYNLKNKKIKFAFFCGSYYDTKIIIITNENKFLQSFIDGRWEHIKIYDIVPQIIKKYETI